MEISGLIVSLLENSEEFVQCLLLLKDGVRDLFKRLPHVSHLRRHLLHYIGSEMPISTVVEWFNVSEETVKSARRLSEVDIEKGLLLVERFISNTHHLDHYFGCELEVFLLFLEEKYPHPSPTPDDNKQFFQQETTHCMWEKYKVWMGEYNMCIIVTLSNDAQYYLTLIEHAPSQATKLYDLMPIRCIDTFYKL